MPIKFADIQPLNSTLRPDPRAPRIAKEKPPTVRRRAPNGTFDRTTYQRELMRKRRAAAKEKSSCSKPSPSSL
jgi:hypothetical protein